MKEDCFATSLRFAALSGLLYCIAHCIIMARFIALQYGLCLKRASLTGQRGNKLYKSKIVACAANNKCRRDVSILSCPTARPHL